MAIGIAGDSPNVSGQPTENLMLEELRVLTGLIQAQMGNQALDDLNVLRADQAFELNLPTPVPGSTR